MEASDDINHLYMETTSSWRVCVTCRLTRYRSAKWFHVPNLEMLVTAEESGAVWIDNLYCCSDAQVSGSLLVGDAWAQEGITRFLEVSSALHSMKWSDQHCLKQYQLEIKTQTCYQNSMSNVSMSWQRIMPHIHCVFASTQFPQKSTKTSCSNRRHLNSITLQHEKIWRRLGIYPNLIFPMFLTKALFGCYAVCLVDH